MISIQKNAVTPTALKEIQDQIEADLLAKGTKFKWESRLYSDPIKNDLKNLYHNKCGFCEIKLTETNTEQKFTVGNEK